MTGRTSARTGATCVTTEWIAGRTGGILTATAATSARTLETLARTGVMFGATSGGADSPVRQIFTAGAAAAGFPGRRFVLSPEYPIENVKPVHRPCTTAYRMEWFRSYDRIIARAEPIEMPTLAELSLARMVASLGKNQSIESDSHFRYSA